MSIVTIAGAGMMGSALAFPARENGHTVRLVGTHLDRDIIDCCRKKAQHPKFTIPFPAGIEYYQIEELSAALDGADMVIGGISSFGVEWFGEKVLPLLPAGVPLLSVTKGLICEENGTLSTYPEYWQKILDKHHKDNPICAIGGPCTSYELAARDQSLVAFCGKDMAVLKKLKKIMSTDYYHVITTTDVAGIESAVALKNGYALAIALTIGENYRKNNDRELHFNSQAAVFLQASREMKKLVSMQGGKEDSFFVGIGDLYVTVYGGRTRKVGILLGEGYTIDEALEKLQGVTLESLVIAGRVAKALKIKAAKGEINLQEFPLLLHADSIITDRREVNIPWESFANYKINQ